MNDRLLKESDVIEVVTQYISCDYPTEEMAREDAEVLIGRTPSADRPQGEWEKIGEDTYYHRCPYCKRIRAFKDSKFCDWCGARMKGADDE